MTTNNGKALRSYEAPMCEVPGAEALNSFLTASFSNGTIDNATEEDWGTL